MSALPPLITAHRAGAWALWIVPAAALVFVLGWETDWGRQILPAPAAGERAWHYPSQGGHTFTTWAGGAEVNLALRNPITPNLPLDALSIACRCVPVTPHPLEHAVAAGLERSVQVGRQAVR